MPLTPRPLRKLGFLTIGLFDEALKLAERSEIPSDQLRSNVLAWRSRCYRRRRDLEAAREDVERALELLGPGIPEHLRYAGELRLKHKQASLDELGHLANPPMTKDAIAGRIRRLLAMADKRAEELGIPATDADLPEDLED